MLMVSYISIWRLRRILNGRYYLVLHVLNGLDGSLEEVIILKSFSDMIKPIESVATGIALYPTITYA